MSLRALLIGVLVMVGAAYAGVLVLLTLAQDTLMFPAPRYSTEQLQQGAQQAGFTPFTVQSGGETIYGMHRPAGGQRALMIFHGNGSSVLDGLAFADLLPDVDIVSFSYRGYPGSTGNPSEAGLVEDARAVYAHVTGPLGIRPDHIVLHGQSLGGGVANTLASAFPVAALVTDSSFTSAVDVAAGAYPFLPVRMLFRHRFDSASRAPGITIPVLILHGTADTLIPLAHAERMAGLYPHAELQTVSGKGHQDWLLLDPTARQTWIRFVRSHLFP